MNARISPVFTFLVTTAVALMAGAIVFSSALRLSHAGLGCADWPACYGRITVPDRVTESGGRDAPAGSWKAVAHRLAGVPTALKGCEVLPCRERIRAEATYEIPGEVSNMIRQSQHRKCPWMRPVLWLTLGTFILTQ